VVGPRKDNYEALREICEQHNVRRLDLHSSSSTTGEDIPGGQDELNLLVEFLPGEEIELIEEENELEQDLKDFFGRNDVGLLRVDNIKPDSLRNILTRNRTLLYSSEGLDEC